MLICSCLWAASCQEGSKPSTIVPKHKKENTEQIVKPVFILIDSVKTANKMIYISFKQNMHPIYTTTTGENLTDSRLTVCSIDKSCKAYDNTLRCNSCGGWTAPTYRGKRIIGAHEVAFQGISDHIPEEYIVINFRNEPFVVRIIQKRNDFLNEKKQEGFTTIYLKPKRKILLKDFEYVPDLEVLKEQFNIQYSKFIPFH